MSRTDRRGGHLPRNRIFHQKARSCFLMHVLWRLFFIMFWAFLHKNEISDLVSQDDALILLRAYDFQSPYFNNDSDYALMIWFAAYRFYKGKKFLFLFWFRAYACCQANLSELMCGKTLPVLLGDPHQIHHTLDFIKYVRFLVLN
jgi:hypothetical protein